MSVLTVLTHTEFYREIGPFLKYYHKYLHPVRELYYGLMSMRILPSQIGIIVHMVLNKLCPSIEP